MANRKTMFLPIQHESSSNLDRCRKSIWDQLHTRMDERQREWEKEMEQLKKSFFSRSKTLDAIKLTSNKHDEVDNGTPGSSVSSCSSPGSGSRSSCYDVTKLSEKPFCCSFDVSQFEPGEITVQTHGHRLVVHAAHLEAGKNKTVCREFHRQIDIPADIDPHSLQSTLTRDGILNVEVVLPSPPPYEWVNKSRTSGDSSLDDSTPEDPAPINNNGAAVGHGSGPDFRVTLDVGRDIDLRDLEVEAVDQKLFVRVRSRDDSGVDRKEMSREFDLPDCIDPSTVKASLTDDGQLILEAGVTPIATVQS